MRERAQTTSARLAGRQDEHSSPGQQPTAPVAQCFCLPADRTSALGRLSRDGFGSCHGWKHPLKAAQSRSASKRECPAHLRATEHRLPVAEPLSSVPATSLSSGGVVRLNPRGSFFAGVTDGPKPAKKECALADAVIASTQRPELHYALVSAAYPILNSPR